MLYKFTNIAITVDREKFLDTKKAIAYAKAKQVTEISFSWTGRRVTPVDLIDYLKNNLLKIADIYGYNYIYDIQDSNLVVMRNNGVTSEEKILFK